MPAVAKPKKLTPAAARSIILKLVPKTLANYAHTLAALSKPDPVRDRYIDNIKQTLKSKGISGYERSRLIDLLKDNGRKFGDPNAYFKQVLTTLGGKVTPFYKHGSKVKPGTIVGMDVPNGPLTKTAQGLLPSPANTAKANKLAATIKQYEAEIARLRAGQELATRNLAVAKTTHAGLTKADPKTIKYFSYIETHCSEFLKVAAPLRKFLYRGQDDTALPIFVGYPRANRQPKDTDEDAQKALDKALTLMGFKALRGNGLFTTPSYSQAEGYGNAYMIFPKNGFSFTWSTKKGDIIVHSMDELMGDDGDGDVTDFYYNIDDYGVMNRFNMGGGSEENQAEDLLDRLTSSGKTPKFDALQIIRDKRWNDMLSEAEDWNNWDDSSDYTIQDLAEIFLTTMGYYQALVKKYPVLSKLFTKAEHTKISKFIIECKKAAKKPVISPSKEMDKELARAIVDEWGFTYKDLKSAIMSDHEICIFGEYVAVSYDAYYKDAYKYFFGVKSPYDRD